MRTGECPHGEFEDECGWCALDEATKETAAAVAEEREECARLVDPMCPEEQSDVVRVLKDVAAAIRARGKS